MYENPHTKRFYDQKMQSLNAGTTVNRTPDVQRFLVYSQNLQKLKSKHKKYTREKLLETSSRYLESNDRGATETPWFDETIHEQPQESSRPSGMRGSRFRKVTEKQSGDWAK